MILVKRKPKASPALVALARGQAFSERGTSVRELAKLSGEHHNACAAALKALGREVTCEWEPFKGELGEPVQIGRYRRRPEQLKSLKDTKLS